MFAPDPSTEYRPKGEAGTFNAVCSRVEYKEKHEFGKRPPWKPESDIAKAIIITWQLGGKRISKDNPTYGGQRFICWMLERFSLSTQSNVSEMFKMWMGSFPTEYVADRDESDSLIDINPATGEKGIDWDNLVGLPAMVTVSKKKTKAGYDWITVESVVPLPDGMTPLDVEYDGDSDKNGDNPDETPPPSDDQSQGTVDNVPPATDGDLPLPFGK